MAAAVHAGAAVWVRLAKEEGNWRSARVVEDASSTRVQLDGETTVVELQALGGLELQNAEEAEDMTSLTHLHEPGVLHNLRRRYARDLIYTATGSIIIAINPHRPLPHLVAPDVMQRYARQPTHAPPSQQQQQQQGEALPPHVFGTATRAYQQMLRDGLGQAILITGESGAGKTETCKLIMRCLAHLGSHAATADLHAPQQQLSTNGHAATNGGDGGGGGSVEQMVLESNPLLEAFGNAKTSRNDNSSRFGKYVEIQFDGSGALRGAAVRTYLLERSRVVHLAPGERSFHAFYQLCAGASAEQRRAWHVGAASDYALLRQSECVRLPHVDDAHEFQVTCQAMGCVGIPPKQQAQVFAAVSAILHLGNVTWAHPDACPPPPSDLLPTSTPAPAATANGNGAPAHPHLNGGPGAAGASFLEAAGLPPAAAAEAPLPAEAASWRALATAAGLLGVPLAGLLASLATRTRHTTDGPITSPLTPAGADEARQALAKVLYARVFGWLVARVNVSLRRRRKGRRHGAGDEEEEEGEGARGAAGRGQAPRVHSSGHLAGRGGVAGEGGVAAEPAGAPAAQHTIGLLDIYGFESFEVNDLEQLCINLANEKLQQHFNQHVFKWEQAEYVREGVDWRYIEFVDNQEVLDLVEGRMGLLDLLDEQCRFPTATADDLAHKYASTLAVSGSKRFDKLRRPPTGFAIQHYAGSVRYVTDNFLDKNKDFVVAEHRALLSTSSSPLVAELFGGTAHAPAAATANGTPPLPPPNGGGAPRAPSGNGALRSGGGGAAGSAFKFDSVAAQFRRQLGELMATLHAMQPHYVRCIKPNAASRPGDFDARYALTQLRCGGVMEAVRISCAGFAYKQPYAAFLSQFWALRPAALNAVRAASAAASNGAMKHHYSEGDLAAAAKGRQGGGGGDGNGSVLGAQEQQQQQRPPPSSSQLVSQLAAADVEVLREAAREVLEAAGVGSFHLGKTKLFLKSQQAAELERKRGMLLGRAATSVQAAWRRFLAQRAYQRLRCAAVALQRLARAALARLEAQRLREQRAAAALQAAWRAREARRQWARDREAVVAAQAAWRARAARLAFVQHQREAAAALLQAAWRARAARSLHAHALAQHRAAVALQAAWRGRAQRRAWAALLPLHRAAARIQRAWRGSRRGTRLREAFRQVVLRAVAAEKAVLVLQTAWRAKAARLELDRQRRLAQRRRFQEQLQRFQAAPSLSPTSSAALPRAGSKPLLPYQIRQQQQQRALLEAGGASGGRQNGAGAAGDGQAADAAAAAGAARPGDGPAASNGGAEGGPPAKRAQRELQGFKLSPLLQMWQNLEQQAQLQQQRSLGRQPSVSVPGGAQAAGRGGAGALAASAAATASGVPGGESGGGGGEAVDGGGPGAAFRGPRSTVH